ncbi:MAG: hypothetical protein JOZ70_09320 [Pseudolabrys sp.]|nr:hypothetical protein [Pseudolabrys sp.]
MLRKSLPWLVLTLALGGIALAQVPAFAFSLVSLEPNERVAMLSTCNKLPGADASLCRNVVDDGKVVANYKRSCLEAITLLLRGGTWDRIRSMPPTLTCREGLSRAGYPVGDIMKRLAGG